MKLAAHRLFQSNDRTIKGNQESLEKLFRIPGIGQQTVEAGQEELIRTEKLAPLEGLPPAWRHEWETP